MDLTGSQFGRWTVLRASEQMDGANHKKAKYWLCKCQCGTIKTVSQTSLKSGRSKSCGCLWLETMSKPKANRKKNDYDLSGEFGIGFTGNTNQEFYFDIEDYDKIKHIHWLENNKDGRRYVESKRQKGAFSLHRIVMNAKKGEYVDHINRNPLDNRKCNLRICTNQQNGFNSNLNKNNKSGVTGVSWDNSRQRWAARIKINYKEIFIGRFENKDDAIVARLKKEKELFGDFSGQKHLFEEFGII